MKAVFDTKPTSIYDDDMSRHYQFPRRYLELVRKSVGDWVVLRRPRADGGNLAYFATARVVAVDSDPTHVGLSYARFSDYLPFDDPVAWLRDGRYSEHALRSIVPSQVGVYLRGRSVRSLTELDYVAIIERGFHETFDPNLASRYGVDRTTIENAREALDSPPQGERAWRIEQVLTNRIIRDAAFRRSVCLAYDNRCAVTRLRIVNGGGRAEVQAAHIWSVATGGPDVVRNGIALSATVHWLFDRHLISLSDDLELLVSHNRVPGEFLTLFARHGSRIHLPARCEDWPHPSYIAKHRETFAATAGAGS